jgi:hypothetical protein
LGENEREEEARDVVVKERGGFALVLYREENE